MTRKMGHVMHRLSRVRRSRWVAAMFMVLFVAALLVVLYILWLVITVSLRMRTRGAGLDEIAEVTGLRFPASATVVNSELQDLPRASLRARLYLDRSDRDVFMMSEPLREAWTEEESPGYASWLKRLGWWETPVGDRRVWVAIVHTPRRTLRKLAQPLVLVEVIVATRDTDTAVVYILGQGS